MKMILVPIDLSESSEIAINIVVSLHKDILLVANEFAKKQ